jgi:hypothetical protein
MAIVTVTVDQRQHRTPHLMNVQVVVGATSSQTAWPTLQSLRPRRSPRSESSCWLQTSLVVIERERRELKERIAALAAQLAAGVSSLTRQ